MVHWFFGHTNRTDVQITWCFFIFAKDEAQENLAVYGIILLCIRNILLGAGRQSDEHPNCTEARKVYQTTKPPSIMTIGASSIDRS